jgi:hypothetical protein
VNDNRPQLFTEGCPSCIFRPGNLMRLREGRLSDIVRRNQATGTALICHLTLPYGEHPEIGETVCRGYYDAYPDTPVIQIARQLLGGFREIPPPRE